MRVIVLTSKNYGVASHHIHRLVNNKEFQVVGVVFNQNKNNDRKKYLLRKLSKLRHIGIFGVLNGIRMRKWYGKDLKKYLELDDINELCHEYKIPFYVTPRINCSDTIEIFKRSEADLGISLGNGYISKNVFRIPKYGMLNIHHALLPDYKNAQSVIWEIYNGSTSIGYTIHKIDERIDNGEILFQETIPLMIKKSLADTVAFNYSRLWESSSRGLVQVLSDYHIYLANARVQNLGRRYTTPNFYEYLKIARVYRSLRRKA